MNGTDVCAALFGIATILVRIRARAKRGYMLRIFIPIASSIPQAEGA
jgi:hypothetical protein